MTTTSNIIIFVLAASLVAILIIFFACSKKWRQQQFKADEKIKIIENTMSASEGRNIELKEQVQHLQDTNNDLREQINSFNSSVMLISHIDKLKAEENAVTFSLDHLHKMFDEQQVKMDEIIADLAAKQLELQNAEKGFHEATERRNVLNQELVHLQTIITDLKNLHSIAVARSEGGGDETNFGFTLLTNQVEKNLINSVQKIKEIVSSEIDDASIIIQINNILSSVAWKKVWLPKIQEKVRVMQLDTKTNCIYRLCLIDDPDICYVGQAKDLKTRWYTHIKKMCGVEISGGEKLYNYSPDSFRWEIIEEKLADGQLNEREKYWIEFYGAKLNMKL